MKEELKYLLIGIVSSIKNQGALQLSERILSSMSLPENWNCIAEKHAVINQSSMWCYDYCSPFKDELFFIQIELQTEFKTVVAINIILNEENKISSYK
jgi:hypothetical protein